jgi:uncharacterized membrane protein YGL010W
MQATIVSIAISLTKAIKSTHRHPVNRILHFIGAPIYIAGIALIVNNFMSGIRLSDLAYGVIIYCTAVALFLIGHRIEGNLRAMTLILLHRIIARSIKRTVSAHLGNKHCENLSE